MRTQYLENSYGIKRDLAVGSEYELFGTNAIKLISADITPNLDIIIIHYKHTPEKMVKLTTGGGDAKTTKCPLGLNLNG